MVPIGLCGGGIAILSNSVSGDNAFVLCSVVSSRDVDLRRIIIIRLCAQNFFACDLLGDACLELDLENFPDLSPRMMKAWMITFCKTLFTFKRIGRHRLSSLWCILVPHNMTVTIFRCGFEILQHFALTKSLF